MIFILKNWDKSLQKKKFFSLIINSYAEYFPMNIIEDFIYHCEMLV